MSRVRTLSLCDISRIGLAVITVALSLWALGPGTADAQQVGIDIAVDTGDQALTDTRDVIALPGETIVIEVFASDFAGQNGVEVVFQLSDPSAIVASSIVTAGGVLLPTNVAGIDRWERTQGQLDQYFRPCRRRRWASVHRQTHVYAVGHLHHAAIDGLGSLCRDDHVATQHRTRSCEPECHTQNVRSRPEQGSG